MLTQFDNLCDQMLADEIGRLDREVKAHKARLDAAKSEFKARGLKQATGEKYAISSSTTTRWTLNTAKIKAAMGQAWIDTHSNLGNVTTIRIAAA